jgi:hypothetical protein
MVQRGGLKVVSSMSITSLLYNRVISSAYYITSHHDNNFPNSKFSSQFNPHFRQPAPVPRPPSRKQKASP